MAKLSGGIFSSPSGNNNGLVFGKGRTKDGKKTTVRELVKPSNPRTNAQQAQRARFTAALFAVRAIGRDIYQIDWNNGIGSLPGFHTLMSRLTDALSSDGTSLEAPEATPLGSRHFPNTFTAEVGTDQIDVSWSTENGDLGAADDDVVVIAIEASASSPDWEREVIIDESQTRTDGSATLTATGVAAGDFVVGMYLKSDEVGLPSGGVRSPAEWVELVSP